MIKIPIEIGDTVYVGRFKNKKIIVKSITYNEYGLPMINGRPLLTLRIEKLMPTKQKNETMKLQTLKNIIREEVRQVIKTKRRYLREEDMGGEIEKDELHVFDFDDTLGETNNLNGVILYKDGNPVHKSKSEAEAWAKSLGAKVEKTEQPGGKVGDAWAVYVMSNNLAPFQKPYSKNQTVTPNAPTAKNDNKDPKYPGSIYVDFTPSSFIDPKTTKPIATGIDRLKAANSAGAKTMVMTARAGEGMTKPDGTRITAGEDFAGKEVGISNEKDAISFLKAQGAAPNQGAQGRRMGDKGMDIAKIIDKDDKEVHFYDDQESNTSKVAAAMKAISLDIPAYIFGGKGSFEEPGNAVLDQKIEPEVAEAVRVRLQKESRKRSKMKMSELRNIVREEARKFKK